MATTQSRRTARPHHAVLDEIGPENVFPTVDSAVDEIRAREGIDGVGPRS